MRQLPGTALRQASLGDPMSRRDLVRLASSGRKCIIRITGGAALMSEAEGAGVGLFLANALGGHACDAAVVSGATAAIDRPIQGECTECDRYRVHCPEHGFGNIQPRPGVMDTLMHLSEMGAPARTIGIVPTIDDLSLYGGFIVVSNVPSHASYTVVDGRCPFCLLLQFSTDRPGLTWDDEWRVCLDYMELLRNEAQHKSLHLVYNGGKVTRNECLHVASLPQEDDNPWQLLLIEDSGRTATDLAEDTEFRKKYPRVASCKKHELAACLQEMGFAPRPETEEINGLQ